VGEDDPAEVAVPYSHQFFDVCRDLGAAAYVISSCAERGFLRDGRFLIEHRPNPLRGASGLLYHLGQVWYGLRIVASAVRFRADVAVVADGTTHWFVLLLLPWLGVSVIPSLHCVLWPKYGVQTRVQRFMRCRSRGLFARGCAAILAVSDDISEQVATLTGGRHRPVLRFSPLYRREQFVGLAESDPAARPFRVLYAGRIERNKGVFDLLEIARGLASDGRRDVAFDICGDGTALAELRRTASEAGVDDLFFCHGHCTKAVMRQMFRQAHIVLVPTRTDFVEGFNKVVVEGVLAGRPVVTSDVCPASAAHKGVVVEVPHDETRGYRNALLKLCDNRVYYEEKRRACRAVREQFYDHARGWGAAFRSALTRQERRPPSGAAAGVLVAPHTASRIRIAPRASKGMRAGSTAPSAQQ
jgi:glycosyltransferase involved in cell wall biosynthesis